MLFVGVSDSGVVLGRPITDELWRHLADLRDQGTILPPPTMTVRKLRIDGGEVAVVEVQPSVAPPVRFKGRVYIRVGPRRGDDQEAAVTPPVITFFNNKGGVGKTTLVYHVAWMLADRGYRVVAADLDPQANLTAAFLDDEESPARSGRRSPNSSITTASCHWRRRRGSRCSR